MSNFFRSRHAPPTPLISHHSFSQYLPPSWQGHLSIFFNLFHFLFILQKHKQTHTHTHTHTHTCVCASTHTHTHTQTRMCTLLSHTLPPVPHSSPPPLPSFSSKVYCKNPQENVKAHSYLLFEVKLDFWWVFTFLLEVLLI